MRVLSITTLKRSRALPNIPTVAESGVPGFETITWYALTGPRGLPPLVVERWEKALTAALQSREMRERFELDGLDAPEVGPPTSTGSYSAISPSGRGWSRRKDLKLGFNCRHS